MVSGGEAERPTVARVEITGENQELIQALKELVEALASLAGEGSVKVKDLG